MAKKRKSAKLKKQRSVASAGSDRRSTAKAKAAPNRESPRDSSQPASKGPAVAVSAAPSMATPRDQGPVSYVGSDVRRVGVILAVCVAIEAVLWVVLHSSSGASVYTWITP